MQPGSPMPADLAARIARARESLARECPDADPLLPALLDVAEAAMNDMEEDAALGRGVDTALAEALARLEEVLP